MMISKLQPYVGEQKEIYLLCGALFSKLPGFCLVNLVTYSGSIPSRGSSRGQQKELTLNVFKTFINRFLIALKHNSKGFSVYF